MRKTIAAILLLTVVIAFVGCSSSFESYITDSQYRSIRSGMTKSQVLDKLGDPTGGPDGGVWQYKIKHEGYSDLVSIIFNDSGRVMHVSKQ